MPTSRDRSGPISSRPLARASSIVVAVAATFGATSSARGQQESAAAGVAPPDPEPPKLSAQPSEIVVAGEGERSPAWTQSRTFAATRFWRLDRGQQEFELWYSVRARKDGVDGDTRHLWQVEYMVSLIRGVQLDVYANYQYDKQNGPHLEGAQIETRIAPWNYGDLFGNPVLYLEWHPQTRDANRGEARLLFGGNLGVPRLRGALNLLVEQNLDSPTGRRADFLADREIGGTAAAAYEVVERALSLGGETRLIWDQQGTTEYQRTMKVGPALWLSALDAHVHLTASMLFGLNDKTDRFNPVVILGYRP